jgi:DNA-binding transcriptional regulator YbjK
MIGKAVKGRSFKGAGLYYLHDKQAMTAQRIGVTETLNLPTSDPEKALKVMAFTAMHQQEIKIQAGEKATGRKLDKPVYVYALSWHPDQTPDPAHMLETAKSSLKALGLHEYQALIVQHTDEPHKHVHVIVNRVHPTTGKAATLSNDYLTLSKWAQGYERETGQVLCHERVKNNNARAQGDYIQHDPPAQHYRDCEDAKNRTATHTEPQAGYAAKQWDAFKTAESTKREAHKNIVQPLYGRAATIKEQRLELWQSYQDAKAQERKWQSSQYQHGKTLALAKLRYDQKQIHADKMEEYRHAKAREGSFLGRAYNSVKYPKIWLFSGKSRRASLWDVVDNRHEHRKNERFNDYCTELKTLSQSLREQSRARLQSRLEVTRDKSQTLRQEAQGIYADIAKHKAAREAERTRAYESTKERVKEYFKEREQLEKSRAARVKEFERQRSRSRDYGLER